MNFRIAIPFGDSREFDGVELYEFTVEADSIERAEDRVRNYCAWNRIPMQRMPRAGWPIASYIGPLTRRYDLDAVEQVKEAA